LKKAEKRTKKAPLVSPLVLPAQALIDQDALTLKSASPRPRLNYCGLEQWPTWIGRMRSPPCLSEQKEFVSDELLRQIQRRAADLDLPV
jgi:hypothetical protein